MTRAALAQIAADAVLALHFAVVVFVVGGTVLIVAGNLAGWRRINGLPFRLLHVLAIVWIALQAWLGQICPLTTLEDWLRRQAGATGYAGSFVQHWLTRLLFYDAPAWVFIAGYSAFALVVVLLWWRFPPRRLS
jgi:hypothetical protein